MKGKRQRTPEGEREARLRAIVSAVPDIIFAIDSDGTYLEVLTSETDLLYTNLETLVGSRVHDVFPPEQAEEFLRVIGETIRTGRPQTLVYQLEVPAGTRWFEGRTAAVNPTDPATDIVFLARDITDRHEIEEALRANESLLQARNQELSDALDKVKTLEGFLKICAYCRRICGEGGEWMPLEAYLSTHTLAQLSHGACPTCFDRAIKELDGP
jgi:PAS domain S-box-containing protein